MRIILTVEWVGSKVLGHNVWRAFVKDSKAWEDFRSLNMHNNNIEVGEVELVGVKEN